MDAVGMTVRGKVKEPLLQQLSAKPWPPRHPEQGEMVGHALKLSPQEQLVAALGFFTLNPPSKAST
jgi:hypothetical protein